MSEAVSHEFPNDVDALKELLIGKIQRIDKLDKQVQQLSQLVFLLQEEKRLAKAARFGPSSEIHPGQGFLFNEVEQIADQTEPTKDAEITVPSHSRRKPGRKSLPKDLPRVSVVYELTGEDCRCGCGRELTKIGEERSEQLDVIPTIAYVIVNVRSKYICRSCDQAPVLAPMPKQPIPGSQTSPGLLAFIATTKYSDAIPLYRLSKILKRADIELTRQTMSQQMMRVGELVQPIINLIKDHILDDAVVQIDETPTRVLKEPGRAATAQSYMWVMRGGPPDCPAVLFHYDEHRNQQVAKDLLAGYQGYLQSDGYSVYQKLDQILNIKGLGCWAHARRKFDAALKALPVKARQQSGRLQVADSYLKKLYRIERRIKDLSFEHRFEVRQAESLPLLAEFRHWLEQQDVNEQSLLGKAIRYTLREWARLLVYCDDGRLQIDNNLVENDIRHHAIGKKNWLFADTPKGATASANLLTLIVTAKILGINEYAYMKYLLTMLPRAGTVDDYEALLPWNVGPDIIPKMSIPPEFDARPD